MSEIVRWLGATRSCRSWAAVGWPSCIGHALEALAYLEERGIARLDLTPDGIMVDERLFPTITKLGLARYVKGESANGITHAGVVVATPGYAAPEQLSGEPVDIRADVYSLTRILLHMLTGAGARAGTFSSVLRGAHESVELEDLDVSENLRAVVQRGLEGDPADRFQNPGEMIAALAGVPEAS